MTIATPLAHPSYTSPRTPRLGRILLWAGVAAGLFLLAQHSLGFLRVAAEAPLAARQIWMVASAIAVLLLGHAVRAEKMVALIKPLHPDCRLAVYRCLFIGYLFNFLLPLRVGELIRAHLLGRALAISRTASLLTIVFERIVDAFLLSLLLIATATLFASPRLLWIAASMLAFAAVLTVGLLYLLRPGKWVLRSVLSLSSLFNDRLRDRLRYSVWSAIRFLQLMRRAGPWLLYAWLSLLMWGLYFGAVLLVFYAFVPTGAAKGLAFSAISYVSASLPAAPSPLPKFLTAFQVLAPSLTASIPEAPRIAAIVWAVLMMPTSILGAFFLLIHPRGPRARLGLVPAEIDKLMRYGQMSPDFGVFLENYFRGSSLVHVLDVMEAKGASRNVRILSGGSFALTTLVDVGGELRVRKLTTREHASKLAAQRQWLEKYQCFPCFPRVLGEASTETSIGIDMPFYGELEPLFNFIHKSEVAVSLARLRAILSAMRDSVYGRGLEVVRPDAVKRYIQVKVIQKIADAARINGEIDALRQRDTLIVNGAPQQGFSPVVGRILASRPMMGDLARYEQTDIHGDLTVDNILVSRTSEEFIVLDPNNENEIGDMIVDIAKLWQSLHSGYEFLRETKDVKIDGNSISFAESRSQQYQEIYSGLRASMAESLPAHRFRALLFHEAVHYCRMLTYRTVSNPQTAPLFFAVAVRLFNEYVAQYDDA